MKSEMAFSSLGSRATWRRLLGLLWLLVVNLVSIPVAIAQETDAELAFDRAQYLEALDQVFETVKDTHWDAELIERVWIPTREKYVDRMHQADSRDQAIDVLQEMLNELKQSHFHIIPTQIYAEQDKVVEQGGEGWSGLTFRMVSERLVVTQVAPNSPAEQAGIQVGWVLERVRNVAKDKTTTEAKILEIANKTEKSGTYSKATLVAILSAAMTSGAIGDTLELTMLDNQDQSQNITLELAQGPGQPTKLGHLPTTYVNFEYRQLPNSVGYIYFNAFLDAPRLIKEYQAALLNEHNANGIVIDLRGNMGGVVLLAIGMSGWFVDKQYNLGRVKQKSNTFKLAINPRKPRFDKPVAILVDECSMSCAELFPGGLQELEAARIFGSRTAGQVIPAQVNKLPTGDGFLFAIAGLESESGFVWEGNGVKPDESIVLTRELLQRDPDPVLTAALKWIAETGR
jgi:carboxyl-terminal processing protease